MAKGLFINYQRRHFNKNSGGAKRFYKLGNGATVVY